MKAKTEKKILKQIEGPNDWIVWAPTDFDIYTYV